MGWEMNGLLGQTEATMSTEKGLIVSRSDSSSRNRISLLQSLSGASGIDVGGLMVDLQKTLSTVAEPLPPRQATPRAAANGTAQSKSAAPRSSATGDASSRQEEPKSTPAAAGRIDDEGVDERLIEEAANELLAAEDLSDEQFETAIRQRRRLK